MENIDEKIIDMIKKQGEYRKLYEQKVKEIKQKKYEQYHKKNIQKNNNNDEYC